LAKIEPSRRTPLSTRLKRAARAIVPLTVWLGGIVGVVALLPYGGSQHMVHGLVESQRTLVTPAVEGRLTAVLVDRHERVSAGQVIGRLSDDVVRLRLQRARLEMDRMRAELRWREVELDQTIRVDDLRQRLESDAELRRRTSELETARIDELEIRAAIAELEVRTQGAAIEAERLTRLETQGIASGADLIRARTEFDALTTRRKELAGVLEQRRQRVLAVQARLTGYLPPEATAMAKDLALEPLRWTIRQQENELEQVAVEAKGLDLIAPTDGHVEEVLLRAGQWVGAGTPVFTIVEPKARRILAYVPEMARRQFAEQAAVDIIRPSQPTAPRIGTVMSVSPALVLVPQRLWRDPRQEEWAWEAVLVAEGDESPGERVSLRLRR
jgi:multidrug resistance efflux pump